MHRKIIIRMDDICPKMKKAPFQRIKKILEKYDATAIIGVVPDCKDPELNFEEEDPHFWDMIKMLQKQKWTIAMHGCYHKYVTSCNGLISANGRSEFAGLSYAEQYKKLKYGKEKLQEHGIVTDVFMAPSHSYDSNTLKALKKLGFKYVTDGLTFFPYEHAGLLFIPCVDAKIKNRSGLRTVCYHPNHMTEQRFKETEELLRNHREDVISFTDAYQYPKISYFRARIEEKMMWIWKYKIVGTIYHIIKG